MPTFTFKGEVVTEAALLAAGKALPKKQVKRDAPIAYHKGWRVMGHRPGVMDEAKNLAEKAWLDYQSMSPKSIMEKYPGGKGIPKPWDENSWRRTTKTKPVRARPYETYDAAVECKRLAELAGWHDCWIEPLSKGKVDIKAGRLF